MPEKRVSNLDVARAAGVSTATVSYVFHGRKGASVPAATRDRITRIAEEMGYRPNRSAQSLRNGQTRVIAFWNSDLAAQITAHVLRLVREYVEADGYDVIVGGNLSPNSVAKWPVDGILAFDSPWQIQAVLDENVSRVPIVSLGPFHLDNLDYVGVDLCKGTRSALRHLIERPAKRGSSRRIAYFVDRTSNVPAEQRHRGYVQEMLASDLLPEFILMEGFLRDTAREVIRHYVAAKGCPEAIFCLNDEIAIGAQRGLQDLGLEIPKDVAVMGCDGIEETEYHFPSISTIVQPLDQVCLTGWQFLKNRLSNPESPLQQTTFDPALELRDSTK